MSLFFLVARVWCSLVLLILVGALLMDLSLGDGYSHLPYVLGVAARLLVYGLSYSDYNATRSLALGWR